MNLFQEMEVNYKDFIESANDFMNSCREYTNINEDENIYLQYEEMPGIDLLLPEKEE